MKKVLFTILISVTVMTSALGQIGPWPFVIPIPGGPQIVGNMEPVKNTYQYTAKIALANSQNALNKAETIVTEILKNTYGLNALAEKDEEDMNQFYESGYLVKKGVKDGKNYVSIRFPLVKGHDVCNLMWNGVSVKNPNILLATVTLMVSGDELDMTFSDFSGCALALVDEMGNIGYPKGMNKEWENDHSKPFKKFSDWWIPGTKNYNKDLKPGDTLWNEDFREILGSHGPIKSYYRIPNYNPTVSEQFDRYAKTLENGSAEFITLEDVLSDLEIQEKVLLPIVRELDQAAQNKDKETVKRCEERIENLLKKQEYLGYNIYSWPKQTIPQMFNNQYSNMVAVRDSGAVIGVNLNIFERYFEPEYNDMIVAVKKVIGDHVISVHYNDVPQYIYNPKSKLAEPADKKAAKRWAGYGREVSKL